MPHWPIVLRLLIVALVFGGTVWAFSAGQMLLAVGGVIASAVAFKRLFLTF